MVNHLARITLAPMALSCYHLVDLVAICSIVALPLSPFGIMAHLRAPFGALQYALRGSSSKPAPGRFTCCTTLRSWQQGAMKGAYTMSLYSFGASNISRAKMQSAVAHYAYISGEEVENEKNGKILKYKREDKVLAKGNIIPEDAPARFRESAATWVNDIEQFEKADNARPAKRFRIALPEEFDLKRQIEVVEQWIYENCTKHGYAATYAIHSSKDGKNPHVHILVSNRPLKKGRWQEAKSKTEYKRDKDGNKIPLLDPETGKQKVIVQKDGRIRPQWQREIKKENQSYMDKCSTIYNMRESWARCCNQFLSQSKQIDHRSYADRGIVQAPTMHEGYAARQIEKRGGVSWRCEHNRTVREINRKYQQALADEAVLQDKMVEAKQNLTSASSALGGAGGIVAGEAKKIAKKMAMHPIKSAFNANEDTSQQDYLASLKESAATQFLPGFLGSDKKSKKPNKEDKSIKNEKKKEEEKKAPALLQQVQQVRSIGGRRR